MVTQIHKGQPSNKTNSLQIIDSSTIPLNNILFPRAKNKIWYEAPTQSMFFDKDTRYSEGFVLTNVNVHDRTQKEVLVNKEALNTTVLTKGKKSIFGF
ncbi:hypothetical protein ABE61_15350 [Lysinibacillus sphaericus]|nr:hypothetical protein [Lysinibacillus sphaericus]MBG9478461.1 hypothetical protein [Lysinibacillus sphaericus]MBG9594774.1 hypothetical protein [Lysinibacillus sphaericus]